MKDILNFLQNYWREIAWILGLILSIVLCCVRKKPVKVVDTLKEKILFELPEVISAAEERFGAGHGAEKLQFVLDFFTWEFSKNGLVMGETYIKFIKSSVENILATPSKKGGN